MPISTGRWVSSGDSSVHHKANKHTHIESCTLAFKPKGKLKCSDTQELFFEGFREEVRILRENSCMLRRLNLGVSCSNIKINIRILKV